ncbi:hypothetical protein KCU95_g9179, partial [Aureobasidium melanogenum]
MAPTRSSMDRSDAQKVADSAIRRATAFQELSARVERAQADSVGLGAVPAHLDIDEIRRQAQENAKTLTSLQQQLLVQDDQKLQRQDMQHQLDNVLVGLNTQGTLPAVTRSKAQIQAQRMACLQFLANTKTDATPQEQAKFPGLVAAAQEPEKLVPGDEYTKEHIMWALGSDTAQDFWTVDEVFQALVSARKTADQVKEAKEENRQLWDMIKQGQQTVDSNFAVVSSTLQRIDTTGQETAKTTQETAKGSRRLENNMQMVVDALGPPDGGDLKRRRPSVQFADTAGALIDRPATAPPTASRRTLPTRQSNRIGSFNQIPPTLQGQTPGAGHAGSSDETPNESETRIQTATNPESENEPSSRPRTPASTTPTSARRGGARGGRRAEIQAQRNADDVLEHVVNRDDLQAVVVSHLQIQFGLTAGSLCNVNNARFSRAMLDSASGKVCVQQKANNLGAGVPADRNGACDTCIGLKRICLQKEDDQPVKVVPLPEALRSGKTADQIGHWVQGNEV